MLDMFKLILGDLRQFALNLIGVAPKEAPQQDAEEHVSLRDCLEYGGVDAVRGVMLERATKSEDPQELTAAALFDIACTLYEIRNVFVPNEERPEGKVYPFRVID